MRVSGFVIGKNEKRYWSIRMIEVLTIPLGAFQVNCYLLIDRDSGEFTVIDAPALSPVFNDLLSKRLRGKQIILTHGHIDHIAALKPLKEKLGCKVAMHKEDFFLLNHVAENPFREMLQASIPQEPDEWLTETSELTVGTFPIHVIHTPGHTPGSVSFYIPGTGVFTGDALFRESVGRTDLPGGNTGVLMESIREKLFALPDDTVVFPGHGPSTKIGHEKIHNPFIQYP
ncbi:MAG: MBL fold metallo-hydrolase [Acidobacteria bacterium]|nr:MAG: MBL fold metallo-hydrolase [Acidobacteriota bacterium]